MPLAGQPAEPRGGAEEIRSKLRIRKTDEELKQEARDGHRQYRGCLRNAIRDHVRRAGAALTELKRRVGHGKWGDWLAKNWEASEETATLYMRVFHNWKGIVKAGLDRDGVTLEQLRRFLAKPKSTKLPTPKVDTNDGGSLPFKVHPVNVKPDAYADFLQLLRQRTAAFGVEGEGPTAEGTTIHEALRRWEGVSRG
jgi:Protein of unknown function (DUF3102)